MTELSVSLCLFRRHEMPPLQLRRGRWLQVFVAAPSQGACGRGCALVPNLIWGRGLFKRSEFRSPHLSGPGQRHQEGHARAPLVLGPFAETKGPRRAGAQPRKTPPLIRTDPGLCVCRSAGRLWR